MKTLFDYIEWRGDLSQRACRFSEVDIAIFSQIVMIEFKDILTTTDDALTVRKLFKKYSANQNLDKNVGLIISNKTNHLFREMASAPRYKNLVVSDYVSEYNEETSEQFSAFTVTLNKHEKLILFSGTDDTLVGWRENFSMLYKTVTAGQQRSVKYVERIAKTCDKLILAGHSKGGNLTTYALYHCTEKTYDKISCALSFDGPGLNKTITKKREERGKKLYEFCPENSVIGRLFHHNGAMKVVHSTFKGMFQHDLFSWEVDKNEFLRVDCFAQHSVRVDEKLRSVMDSMTDEDKVRFANLTFDTLEATGAKTLTELALKKFDIVKCYLKLNADDKKFLKKIFLSELGKDKWVREMLTFDLNNKEAQAVIKNSKKYAVLEEKERQKELKQSKKK